MLKIFAYKVRIIRMFKIRHMSRHQYFYLKVVFRDMINNSFCTIPLDWLCYVLSGLSFPEQ